jgi:hypothetical protein
MKSRIRKTGTEKEYEEILDEYITLGYDVKERGEKTTRLVKSEYGGIGSHALIFIFIGWWTFFIPNIIWLIYNYYSNSNEVLLKIIEEKKSKEGKME